MAVDRSDQHLKKLARHVDPQYKRNLTLIGKIFPAETFFESESFDYIHAGMVFHFLEGNEVEKAFQQIYKWLKRGGKFFVTICTPYNHSLKEFIPTFLARKTKGDPLAGDIENLGHLPKNDINGSMKVEMFFGFWKCSKSLMVA